MQDFNRRNFIKLTGLSILPLMAAPVVAQDSNSKKISSGESVNNSSNNNTVWFVYDGPMYDPQQYIQKLKEIDEAKNIQKDIYGTGGSLGEMLEKFAAITGKEAAIYMPSGTMANQLAIHLLSGDNTKVFVQETSHVYRDEGDAAQAVFGKRLIPLAKGEAFFTAAELKSAIDYHNQGEVFKSGNGGVVSIELPVRRSDGAYIPFENLKAITDESVKAGYKLHLDGARIYMVTATTGRSVAEYASLFDTVYISLYKYLGAAGGAVLCGSKELIDKMHHQVKVHGGNMYTSWSNAAMVLHHLEGIDERLQKVKLKTNELLKSLNAINRVKISPAIKNGTNIYNLKFSKPVDSKKAVTILRDTYNIVLNNPGAEGVIKVIINETLLNQNNAKIVDSFKDAVKAANGKS